LCAGGILDKYAAERVETHLITVTRWESGWPGDVETYPGHVALGKPQESVLRPAARVLDLKSVEFLDYIDGELVQVDSTDAIAKIVAHI
jgi:LmbE family N-acetylglucosaminyl deacetylase